MHSLGAVFENHIHLRTRRFVSPGLSAAERPAWLQWADQAPMGVLPPGHPHATWSQHRPPTYRAKVLMHASKIPAVIVMSEMAVAVAAAGLRKVAEQRRESRFGPIEKFG